MRGFFAVTAVVVALSARSLAQPNVTGPQLLSVFPLALQKGTSADVRIRGASLLGTHGVWFDCNDLEATVTHVKEIVAADGDAVPVVAQSGAKKYEVTVRVQVNQGAATGRHAFRLVTSTGVSDPLSLSVLSDPVMLEAATTHAGPTAAQLVSVPAVVNGRLAEKGEVDYYSFDAAEGQRLSFEVATANGLGSGPLTIFNEPSLNLYEFTGSWFDPNRTTRLAANDVSSFFYYPETEPRMFHFLPRLVQRFGKPGRYLVGVGATDGQGGPDHSYMLRIAPAAADGLKQIDWAPSRLLSPDPLAWQERDFLRHIQSDRVQGLLTRGVTINSTESPQSVSEQEPSGGTSHAMAFHVPAIVAGVIGQPDEEDYFKFHADGGDQLAFEIETPEQRPPYFSPRLSIVDANGHEVFTNIYRKIDGNGVDWTKSIEPKTLFTFDRAGDFFLKIRDLTTQRGAPNFKYRVLVRSQVPHVGEIAFKTFPVKAAGNERYLDRVNLAAGESRSITVVADLEEGFDGEVVIGVEGLPAGVTALPAAATPVEVYSKGAQGQGLELFADLGAPNKERYRPRRLTATLILSAAAECRETRMPIIIRFTAQAVVRGKAGTRFPFQEMPLMIVRPQLAQGPARMENKNESRPGR